MAVIQLERSDPIVSQFSCQIKN